ncbi:MAG TPA: sigma-70 family RNA polymerase sigma factor, partial [Ignavibacteria bacterium]|nr:sigma-70 family RNA polymerase sigma factor [Ignavibacteria bacterium]
MNKNYKENKEDLYQAQVLNLDDDFSLIKRFIEGDESAFSILMIRHKEKVRSIVFITVNNHDVVDDISQEVFLIVYKNLNKFRFESQFTTWLYRITVNKCKDYLRKMKIRSIFSPINEWEHEFGYTPNQENIDIKEIVQNAIS